MSVSRWRSFLMVLSPLSSMWRAMRVVLGVEGRATCRRRGKSAVAPTTRRWNERDESRETRMDVPRIGVSLPHFGPYVGTGGGHSGPGRREGRVPCRVGRAAADAGPAGLEQRRGLPESHVWDPLELLTWAARTRRIAWRTGIVNAIFQPPIVLARRLATLDRLSGGRLDAGLGQGGGGTEETGLPHPGGVRRRRRSARAAGGRIRRARGRHAGLLGPRPRRVPPASATGSPVGRRPQAVQRHDPAVLRSPGALDRRAGRPLADGVILVAVDWERPAHRSAGTGPPAAAAPSSSTRYARPRRRRRPTRPSWPPCSPTSSTPGGPGRRDAPDDEPRRPGAAGPPGRAARRVERRPRPPKSSTGCRRPIASGDGGK